MGVALPKSSTGHSRDRRTVRDAQDCTTRPLLLRCSRCHVCMEQAACGGEGLDLDTEAWTVEGITGRALWALSPRFCLKGPSIFRDQCEIWHVPLLLALLSRLFLFLPFLPLPFPLLLSLPLLGSPFQNPCSSQELFWRQLKCEATGRSAEET